jgi:hypothetical protein
MEMLQDCGHKKMMRIIEIMLPLRKPLPFTIPFDASVLRFVTCHPTTGITPRLSTTFRIYARFRVDTPAPAAYDST